MDWIQVLTILGGNIAIFLPIFFWLRSEANADRRDLYAVLREDRKDILSMINEIKLENKDFHYRLLEIEKARIK